MENDMLQPALNEDALEVITTELAKGQSSKRRRIARKFVLAAIGEIPWVGGVLAAIASIRADEADVKADDLRTEWLEEHNKKLSNLRDTLDAIEDRFESLGATIDERIQSEEFLTLVRQAFRTWDHAETEEKRQFVANLVANSAGTRVCSDDVVRLFISWIDLYHEAHFAVIREIHENPGSTRFEIWSAIYGKLPREDSAEADLFRMLIRDLSTGGVIRQARDTTEAGEFLRRRAPKQRAHAPTTMKSSFDDQERYVLTDLGKQFVHYTLIGDIRRLESNNAGTKEG